MRKYIEKGTRGEGEREKSRGEAFLLPRQLSCQELPIRRYYEVSYRSYGIKDKARV